MENNLNATNGGGQGMANFPGMDTNTGVPSGTNVNEGANANVNTNGQGQTNGGGNQTGQDKTYSEKDFQSALDKRVNEALKTAREKWQTEYDEKLQAEKKEAERLAKMNADERAKAEFEKDRQKFESERLQFSRERLEFECANQLSQAGLPVGFSKILTGNDADSTKANIESFNTAWTTALEAAVNERLKGKSPEMGLQGNSNTDPFLAGFGK